MRSASRQAESEGEREWGKLSKSSREGSEGRGAAAEARGGKRQQL